MIAKAVGALIAACLLTGAAVAAEKNAPKLTKEAKDGARITQENIVKMKLKTVKSTTPNTPMSPSLGGPPPPPPPAPPSP